MKETTKDLIQTWEASIRTEPLVPLSPTFFSYTKEENHQEACTLFRYVFENILEWSPYDVVNYLTFEVIEKLNLKKAFANLIYPPEYKERRCSTFYVGVLCYPEIVKEYRKTDLWIMEYNAVKHKGRGNFVTFDGEEGYDKARFLLNYHLINSVDPRFTDLETVYAFFASNKAHQYLKDNRLIAACGHFFHNPLEYFHESLAEDVGEDASKSDFLLQFTEYKSLDDKLPTFNDAKRKRRSSRQS